MHDELVEVRGVVLLGGATAAEIRLVQGDVLPGDDHEGRQAHHGDRVRGEECSLVGRKSS